MKASSPDRRWRVATFAEEAIRNLGAYWPRSILLAIAVAAVVAIPTAAEISSIANVVALVDAMDRGGHNVLVATPTDSDRPGDTGINASVCDSLTLSPNVKTSGWVSEPSNVDIGPAGANPAAMSQISPGALLVLHPSLNSTPFPDVIVSQQTAQVRGLAPGSKVAIDKRDASISATYDADTRVPSREATLFAVQASSTTAATECLVETTWAARSTLGGLLVSVLGTGDSSVLILPLRNGGIFERNPQLEYRSRSSQRLWMGSAAAASGLALLVTLGRRRDIGLYRSLRMRRSEVVLTLGLEWIAITFAGCAGAAVYACWVAFSGDHPPIALAYGLRAAALGGLGTIAGASLAVALPTIGATGNLLKDG